MNHRFLLLVCTIVLLVNVATSQRRPSQSNPGTLDDWAKTYNLSDPVVLRTNIAELKNAINPVSPNTKRWSTFDIIAKIPQKETGPINETIVWKVQTDITASLNKSNCFWTYNSTYLSFTDAARYTLYGGIKCRNDREYVKLVDEPLFHKNVLFARLIGTIKSHIKPSKLVVPTTSHSNDHNHDWSATPVSTENACDDYSTTPHRNWWSDAMTGGPLDCGLIKDDCTYNQGYGGQLYLIDTGVTSAHPEFAGMINNGKLTYREYLTAEELEAGSHPKFDEQGHGTVLASLTIGKSLGSVKHAKLTSIKAVYLNDTINADGFTETNMDVSITAITKALNQIIADAKNTGYKYLRPSVIYTGINLAWDANSKCHMRFVTMPSEAFIKQKRDIVTLVPGEISPNPPMGGIFNYDCAFPVVQAVKNLIAHGVPYLTTTMNGFMSDDGVTATGVDICFYAQWVASVQQCVPYVYLPLFMVNPYASAGTGSTNQGYTNRALVIGGYQEDFENARWSTITDEGFVDIGGANYGSEWYRTTQNKRCMDYAAPATRFQTLPVLPGIAYGSWGADLPGIVLYDVTGNYTAPDYPLSGTSYSIALAAGSILTTLVEFWSELKPNVELPDYAFGDRVVDYVDHYNVIQEDGESIHVTEDEAISYLYDYYGWFISESDVDNGWSCASIYGIHYTSNNYPTPITKVTVPHNRNLMIPQFRSRNPICPVVAAPVPLSPN